MKATSDQKPGNDLLDDACRIMQDKVRVVSLIGLGLSLFKQMWFEKNQQLCIFICAINAFLMDLVRTWGKCALIDICGICRQQKFS